MDANTGQIIAAELTSNGVDDGSQVGPLLEQIAGPVASFTGDGAYDRDDVYREVCQRHPDAAVIVPPRSSAVPSAVAKTAPTKRDRHLQLIAERGRMGWQRASGYNWRALVGSEGQSAEGMTVYSREQIIGHATAAGRTAYVAVIRAGRPVAIAKRTYNRAYIRTIPPCWVALLASLTPPRLEP